MTTLRFNLQMLGPNER